MGLPFEVIDHTADIGIIARGSDLAALFCNAAAGMLSLLTDVDTLRQDTTRGIRLEANDRETLLVAWLNEILYIIYTEKLILCKFDILIDGNRLAAKCAGQELEPKDHRIGREIKAATYHDLEIVERDGEYSAKIIFDI
jgi:SHS2 domain-containing protein